MISCRTDIFGRQYRALGRISTEKRSKAKAVDRRLIVSIVGSLLTGFMLRLNWSNSYGLDYKYPGGILSLILFASRHQVSIH